LVAACSMSVWTLMILIAAGGGALLVWNMVSRTKHVSEEMLKKYREMLAEARAERARKLQQSSEKVSTAEEAGADDNPS